MKGWSLTPDLLARESCDPLERTRVAAPSAACKGPMQARREDGAAHALPPRDYLLDLMMSPGFAGKLSPEEEVSLWCAAGLRQLTRARKLRAVWSMVPGENKQGGRLGVMHQARVIALGYVPGCSDFLFLWGTGSGGIELKVDSTQTRLSTACGKLIQAKARKTSQRPNQKLFQRWCEDQGVRYAVAHRWGEMEAILRDWGVLDDSAVA